MLASELLRRILAGPWVDGAASTLSGYVPQLFESDLIDLTIGSNNPAFGGNLPNLPTKYIVPHTARFLFTSAAGTLTGSAPTIQLGTNGTFNNIIPTTTLTLATINTAITNGGPPFALGLTIPTSLPYPALVAANVKAFVQTPSTGATSLKGRIQIIGRLRTVGDP